MAWKCGFQPFSCPCSQNATHRSKEICWTCLSKESIPANAFGNSKHPLPTRSSFLRAAARTTCSAFWLHHAHPFAPAAEKKPVSCKEAEGLVTQFWSPRFVTMQCFFSQLWYETAANQRTLVEIELLATVGWKCGCQPFSCPCSKDVTRCPQEICWTCLSKESIPAIAFGNSKHPLPTRSRFLRARVGSTKSASCLHDAHPFVAAAEKNLSQAEKQRVWSRSCRLHKLYRFVTMQ